MECTITALQTRGHMMSFRQMEITLPNTPYDALGAENMLIKTYPCLAKFIVMGQGYSSVVQCQPLKGHRFKQKWQEVSFSRVNFLCQLLFWYPFHPMFPVTCKRFWSFCQNSAGGRSQINTHAPYVCGLNNTANWCLVVGCMQNMQMAAVSHVTSQMHVTTK